MKSQFFFSFFFKLGYAFCFLNFIQALLNQIFMELVMTHSHWTLNTKFLTQHKVQYVHLAKPRS